MNVDVADLKRHVDLAALVEVDLGPPHKHHGRWWMWRCPFHNDRRTPSLAVTPDTGTWHCFGCEKSGDHITWLQEQEGLSFQEAVNRLTVLAGQGLPQPTPSRPLVVTGRQPTESWQQRAGNVVAECEATLWQDQGAKARAWLNQRGLTDETVRRWRLGYNPTDQRMHGLWVPGGITIPCFALGELRCVKVRRPVPPASGPKYLQVKGGSPALFGLDALDGKQAVFICEGEFDAILLRQHTGDLVDVVAVGSATSRPSLRFLLPLAQHTRWFVVLDRDDAGDKGAAWWGDFSERVQRVRPLQGNDVTDFHLAGGSLRQWVVYHLRRAGLAIPSPAVTHTTDVIPSLEEQAEVLLRQYEEDPEWARQWAQLHDEWGVPCYGYDSWAAWAKDAAGSPDQQA